MRGEEGGGGGGTEADEEEEVRCEEEEGFDEVEVAADGTRWVAGRGTARPLIVTTDPAAPRSSVGPPPCQVIV